jgi:prophage antirepressor-like protein
MSAAGKVRLFSLVAGRPFRGIDTPLLCSSRGIFMQTQIQTSAANIVPFQFENFTVRVVEIDGKPWFVAKDVAETLGYDQTANGLKHCKRSSNLDEMNKINGLAPATKWIPESDVYRMVLRSTLESAERFQDWVVEEVLPKIRKTGRYSASEFPEEQPAPQPTLPPLERAVALAVDAVKAAEAFGFTGNQATLSANKLIHRHTGINMLESMDHKYLEAPDNEQLITPTDIEKHLGLKHLEGNKLLTRLGFQTAKRDHKNKLKYEPTSLGNQYAVMVDVDKRQGKGAPIRQLRWRSSIIAAIENRQLNAILGEIEA